MGTFSTNLLLSLLAFGESAANGFDNWGESANSNFSRLDAKLGNKASISLAAGDVTLSASAEASIFLEFTGTIPASRTVNVSSRPGFWMVSNATVGGHAVSFRPEGGTGVDLPEGTSIVYSDGASTRLIQSAASGSRRILLQEDSSFALASGAYKTINGIPGGLSSIDVEMAITSISINPGIAGLYLSVGNGLTWFEYPAFLTRWTNGDTTSRAFTARISCVDDLDLPITLVSTQNDLTPNSQSVGVCRPQDYTTRPISAIRARIVPQSGSVTMTVRKLRVWGNLA